VEVHIGVTQVPKEIEVDLPDDTDRDALVSQIDAALADAEKGGMLWLDDRRGRRVGVPAAKVAYVEIGSPADERRVGFGAHLH
jgi:Protein of unknown function (DUF3107)